MMARPSFPAPLLRKMLLHLLLPPLLLHQSAAKCPKYPPAEGRAAAAAAAAAAPTAEEERTSMVWVSLSGYDAAAADATLQLLRAHRRSITHISLVAYNFNGSRAGGFSHGRYKRVIKCPPPSASCIGTCALTNLKDI